MSSLCASFVSTSPFQEHVFCNVETTRKATKQKFCGYNWVLSIIFMRFCLEKCRVLLVFTGYGPFWKYGWYFFLIFHQPGFSLDSPRNFPNRISGLSLSPHVAVSMYGSWSFEHTPHPPQPTKTYPPPNNQFFTPYLHWSIITIWITNNYIQKSYKLIDILLNCHHHYLKKWPMQWIKSTTMLINKRG